jgi:hypothetical protein
MSNDNVVTLKPRATRTAQQATHEHTAVGMQRYPVDIRGHVTFGRLMSGLATVGLSVRVDPRSGRVVITDDAWE